MNAKRVTLRAYSAEVASATKAGSLGEGGYASAGFAEVCEDATAVKPWSFTPFKTIIIAADRIVKFNPAFSEVSLASLRGRSGPLADVPANITSASGNIKLVICSSAVTIN
jgi:hypothetical protein